MLIAIDKKDLEAEAAISLFLQSYFVAQRYENSPVGDKTYDVKFWLTHGGELYCEIKTDWASEKYGNAFFEIHNTSLDIPSGLVKTIASVWAHYLPANKCLVLVDPKALLWWLATHMRLTPKYKIRLSSPRSGDGNAQGYIVPCSVLLERKWIERLPYTLPGD